MGLRTGIQENAASERQGKVVSFVTDTAGGATGGTAARALAVVACLGAVGVATALVALPDERIQPADVALWLRGGARP
jgi:hypothetical protein